MAASSSTDPEKETEPLTGGVLPPFDFFRPIEKFENIIRILEKLKMKLQIS